MRAQRCFSVAETNLHIGLCNHRSHGDRTSIRVWCRRVCSTPAYGNQVRTHCQVTTAPGKKRKKAKKPLIGVICLLTTRGPHKCWAAVGWLGRLPNVSAPPNRCGYVPQYGGTLRQLRPLGQRGRSPTIRSRDDATVRAALPWRWRALPRPNGAQQPQRSTLRAGDGPTIWPARPSPSQHPQPCRPLLA